jgi:signal transduction histidine kinase
VSLWLVPLSIVVLTLVLDQALRRLVYRPIAAIRQTMARAGAGELAARVEVVRSDEMGEVATGLNQMLERLADFNLALEDRIRTVTSALDRSHTERIDSYQRMLAMRDALAEAERLAAVGQTAASVAHQVGTPLNLISGHVQLLLAQGGLPPDTERRLRVVQDQIGKVTNAVRGLVEHVRRPGPDAPIDVGDLLGAIGVLVRPRLTASGIRISEDIASGLPPVRGDRSELEMALLNLVSNAVDAMPAGGDLRVGASAMDDGLQIVVADSGSGIPPDLLPRIFEPWVTSKPPGRGTGLGLSITRDVIERMGGTIAAASVHGDGTVFTIALPADRGVAS